MSTFSPEVQGAVAFLQTEFTLSNNLKTMTDALAVFDELRRLKLHETKADTETIKALDDILGALTQLMITAENLRKLTRDTLDARRRDGVSKERAALN